MTPSAERAAHSQWFNIAQTALLFGVLFVCIYEHRLHVGDQEEFALLFNRVVRWAIPFGYYPILVFSFILWPYNQHSPLPWVVLALGWTLLTVHCARRISYLGGLAGSKRANIVAELRAADPSGPQFTPVLNSAFGAFDADSSGAVSMEELRVLLDILYPDRSRIELAEMTIDLKPFLDASGELNEVGFVDAVHFLVRKHPLNEARSAGGQQSGLLDKWTSVDGLSSSDTSTPWSKLLSKLKAGGPISMVAPAKPVSRSKRSRVDAAAT